MLKIKIFNSKNLDKQELNLAIEDNNMQGLCLIGRSPNSGLVLDSPDVSRLHGKLFLQNKNYYFCDLGSRNGSIVNGELAKTNQNYVLQAGDVVRIGEFILIIENISEVIEETPATVLGGIDATVISNWRALTFDASTKLSQGLKLKNNAQELVEESVQVSEVAGEISEEDINKAVTPNSVECELVSEVPEVISEAEVTYIQVPEISIQTPEELPIVVTDIQSSDATQKLNLEEVALLETSLPETVDEIPQGVSEVAEARYNQVPEIITQSSEGLVVIEDSSVSEKVIVNSETLAPEAVNDIVVDETKLGDIYTLETSQEESIEDTTQEPTKSDQIFEVSNHQEVILTQASEEVEVFEINMPPSDFVTQASDKSELESAAITPSKISKFKNDEVCVKSAAIASSDETPMQEEANNGVRQILDISINNDVDTTESSESSEPFDALPQESEKHEIAMLPNIANLQKIKAIDQVSPQITQTQEVAEQSDNQNSEFFLVIHAPVIAVETSEVSSQPSFEETAEISEIVDQALESISDVPKINSQKYIVLMAHDSKKPELVQFVSKHKEFFSESLTITTPAISETLHQQANIETSKQTPTGKYQVIASLIGSGDILAVIFLRDFLVAQPGQANEEALLRLCNINQILFATNTPTAEALVHFIKK